MHGAESETPTPGIFGSVLQPKAPALCSVNDVNVVNINNNNSHNGSNINNANRGGNNKNGNDNNNTSSSSTSVVSSQNYKGSTLNSMVSKKFYCC